jgi:hypothetical protein
VPGHASFWVGIGLKLDTLLTNLSQQPAADAVPSHDTMSADAEPFHVFCVDPMSDSLMSNKPLVANLCQDLLPLFGMEFSKSMTAFCQ